MGQSINFIELFIPVLIFTSIALVMFSSVIVKTANSINDNIELSLATLEGKFYKKEISKRTKCFFRILFSAFALIGFSYLEGIVLGVFYSEQFTVLISLVYLTTSSLIAASLLCLASSFSSEIFDSKIDYSNIKYQFLMFLSVLISLIVSYVFSSGLIKILIA